MPFFMKFGHWFNFFFHKQKHTVETAVKKKIPSVEFVVCVRR